mmetsp:Transcript_14274/g.35443  ORF Transcript_14274/g.35443 Transcript_14274/m.35443 type:complete len:337 (-) Transcript_14274:314-1324(-)|eukprot:CAMPEP_0178998206 /NCGR_PEP_ID=MMETSP0795-20121207/9395_1 /TAXON_ID=88552 /ORGANISM="Amoebophrya sp., Strain Ameob2" /LENGTH=336 /DNA_ID=CAMNT_0020690881 /DNA_START=280 /DNA_END=1290 /DNA_ORIENTATION=-
MIVSFRAREGFAFGITEFQHESAFLAVAALQFLAACLLVVVVPVTEDFSSSSTVHQLRRVEESRSRVLTSSEGEVGASLTTTEQAVSEEAVRYVYLASLLGFALNHFFSLHEVSKFAFYFSRRTLTAEQISDSCPKSPPQRELPEALASFAACIFLAAAAVVDVIYPAPSRTSYHAYLLAGTGCFLLVFSTFANGLSVGWAGTPGKLGLDDQLAVLTLGLRMCAFHAYAVAAGAATNSRFLHSLVFIGALSAVAAQASYLFLVTVKHRELRIRRSMRQNLLGGGAGSSSSTNSGFLTAGEDEQDEIQGASLQRSSGGGGGAGAAGLRISQERTGAT